MKRIWIGLLLLAAPAVSAERKLELVFVGQGADLQALRALPGVGGAAAARNAVVLLVDPYSRLTLHQIEKAAGLRVDRERLRLHDCVHLLVDVPKGGGGSAPCLESPTRGCFSAGSFTHALARLDGIAAAEVADMRPGGALAWQIVPEKGAAPSLAAMVAAVAPRRVVDVVLSGVFRDHRAAIPSETLPKPRPDSVPSASPRTRWLTSISKGLARAKREKKMLLLVVHHFD